jgi:phenylacetate-CoA ligase
MSTFFRWYRFLQKSQYVSCEEKKRCQTKKFREIIQHAYRNVPYYHMLFKKCDLRPADIKTLSDLRKIPMLTRDAVQKNVDLLKSMNYPTVAFKRTMTGGTTGSPLEFYVEKARWLGIHFAFNKIYMDRAAYRWNDRVVSFTGCTQKSMYHPFLNTLELSSFHTSKKDFEYYYQQINKFKPRFITAYPSAITLFSKYINQQSKQLSSPLKAVFLHGETLFEWQRTLLEKTYDCLVFDQYGHREQCVLAATCEKSNQYHIFPEYGVVEVLNPTGDPIRESGEKGEIVATSLHNTVFPFIRYRTGDIGILGKQSCGCGRSYPMLQKLLGRTQEYLISKDHDKISATGLYHIISEYSHNVKECQLYQDTAGEIIIYLVKLDGFSSVDEKEILQGFAKRFDESFSFQVRYTNEITRSKQGKYRYVIQKIPDISL